MDKKKTLLEKLKEQERKAQVKSAAVEDAYEWAKLGRMVVGAIPYFQELENKCKELRDE